jgi:hypothetical protein
METPRVRYVIIDVRLVAIGAVFLGPFDGNTFRIAWNSYAILPTYGVTNVMKVSSAGPHEQSR